MDDPLPSALAAARQALQSLPTGGNIGIAVSGGSDSTALLHLALEHLRGRLQAVTIDHGLRLDSADESAQVAENCQTLDLTHTIVKLAGLEGGSNLQARARNARYDALTNWARQRGLSTVLLGHTMDDQAETVLMRLARGSGVSGLAGMEAATERQGIRWVRPLLGVRRAALRNWLTAQGVPWIDDPSNDDLQFGRIKARKALESLGNLGISVEGLATTANVLRSQAQVLDQAADSLLAQANLPAPQGTVCLDRQALARAPQDTALRVLAKVLCDLGRNPYRPRHRSLAPLYDRICCAELFRASLAGCLIDTKRNAAQVHIEPEPAASATR
ncbi:MAG: tRNA lysidine(34) synthetase TilS [Pseudomonadota bacterium]